MLGFVLLCKIPEDPNLGPDLVSCTQDPNNVTEEAGVTPGGESEGMYDEENYEIYNRFNGIKRFNALDFLL